MLDARPTIFTNQPILAASCCGLCCPLHFSVPHRTTYRESPTQTALAPTCCDAHQYHPHARSRSAITSSGCSPPTQRRTMFGGMWASFAALLALLLVGRDGGDRRHALDAPQVGRRARSAGARRTSCAASSAPAADAERHQVAVAVDRLSVELVVLGVDQPHVAAGQLVERMARAARGTARSRPPVLLEELGDPHRAAAHQVDLRPQRAHVVQGHDRLQRVQVRPAVAVRQVLDVGGEVAPASRRCRCWSIRFFRR